VFVIAGLGNPGSEYATTRHNAGFMLVDRLAGRQGRSFQKDLRRSLTCRFEYRGVQLLLAKPKTYMNLSGTALREILHRYPANFSDLLIVYDDIALPLGKIRLRATGSSGGHRGMQSVIEALGSIEIPRLRIGVSTGEPPADCRDYVLSSFNRSEQQILEETLERAADAVETFVTDGMDRAMSQFN
jgi:peptidyl-tRNA hydrolase, PTH1 family